MKMIGFENLFRGLKNLFRGYLFAGRAGQIVQNAQKTKTHPPPFVQVDEKQKFVKICVFPY